MTMSLREWLMLLLAILVGLGGLFYASAPDAGAAYGIGLVVFGVAVIYGFMVVKRHFDEADAQPR